MKIIIFILIIVVMIMSVNAIGVRRFVKRNRSLKKYKKPTMHQQNVNNNYDIMCFLFIMSTPCLFLVFKSYISTDKNSQKTIFY